jgi:hypothetical protein
MGRYFASPRCASSEDIIRAYKHYTSEFYEQENFLDLILESIRNEANRTDASFDTLHSPNCWDGRTTSLTHSPIGMTPSLPDANRWNECCSFFLSLQERSESCYDPSNSNHSLCCYFSLGTDNHLALPALREPSVTIQLEQSTIRNNSSANQMCVQIEQEGQLGLYDVSGVLWPAGYLLGLCLNDPILCGVPDIINITMNDDFLALELGAGLAFPSIAFAKSKRFFSGMGTTCDNNHVCTVNAHSPKVVATDLSRSSLGLAVSNLHLNGVGDLVNVSRVDHMSIDSLSDLHQTFYPFGGGFDLIFGSSLQAFFDGTSDPDAILWHALDLLLSRTNADAMVLFAHVRTGNERISAPNSTHSCGINSFELVRRISGDVYSMSTRDGSTSDFELVVLKRRICSTDI